MDFLGKVYFQSFPGPIRKGDLKKYAIIQTAVATISKDGVEGLGFDHIARKMKTRRSHITYYFETQEDLLDAIFKYITATAQAITIEAVTQAKTPRERILAICSGAFQWVEKHHDQMNTLLLIFYIAGQNPHFKKLQTEIRSAGYERLKTLLQMAFGPAAPPEERLGVLARSLQCLITGYIIEMRTTAHAPKVDFQAMCEAFLAASFPEMK